MTAPHRLTVSINVPAQAPYRLVQLEGERVLREEATRRGLALGRLIYARGGFPGQPDILTISATCTPQPAPAEVPTPVHDEHWSLP